MRVVDKVWMSKAAKLTACKAMVLHGEPCLLVAWFEETFREMQHELAIGEDDARLMRAEDVEPLHARNKLVIFAEHYPLSSVEQQLFLSLGIQEAPVLSSLDDPLFQLFGGERTIELMRKLGMDEHEVIGHPFVTKAIRNAQKKLADKIRTEHKASSQQDWFARNLNM